MLFASQLMILFTIYSFAGWVCETIFCSILEKKFVDRGFLNGPFCPIYGFGGLIIIKVLSPFTNNILLLYIISVIVTTAIEYLTGVMLETIFHTTWWDYSDCKFNFEGRICLLNSLLFGVMCVVGLEWVHPFVYKLVKMIQPDAAVYIAGALVAYFIIDMLVTLYALLQLKGKLEQLQHVLDQIKEKTGAMKEKGSDGIKTIQNAIGSFRSDSDESYETNETADADSSDNEELNSLYEQQDKMEKGTKFLQRRIIRAFPTMKSKMYNESLSHIKDMILGKISKNK